MKIIQLNVWKWTMFEEIRDFIVREQPDIILFQEVSEGIMCDDAIIKQDHLKVLEGLDPAYRFVFAPGFGVHNKSGGIDQVGVAVLTKYPIMTHSISYVPVSGDYCVRDRQDLGFDIDVSIPGNKDKKYPLYESNSSAVLTVQLEVAGTSLRVITSHFTASSNCTETIFIRGHAAYIAEMLIQETDIPTIVGGDFNIIPDSHAIGLLREHLTLINDTGQNTLNPRIHPGFKNNIGPEGYQVDHLLCTGCSIDNWEVLDVDVSDHLPVMAELTLSQ